MTWVNSIPTKDDLGNTPFQLISDFFHVNKVFSVLSMLSKLPPGVCWRGGGGATGLLNKGGGGGGMHLKRKKISKTPS